MAELAGLQWAMTADSFQGILSALDNELTADDYAKFHKMSADQHLAAASILGEPVAETLYTRVSGSVGSITINGPIVPRASALTESSGVVSTDRLSQEFQALDQDPSIDTILMVIDSPGGAVTGITEFTSVLKDSQKATIAYVFGSAASLAYWMAGSADSIVSADTGLVGSIGVVYSAGPAGDGEDIVIRNSQSPRKQPNIDTDAGREDIVAMLDQLADVFISSVAEGRGVASETVLKDFGQGAMFGAAEAKARNMVDAIMPLHALVASLQNSDTTTASFVPQALDIDTNHAYISRQQNVCQNPLEENMTITFDELKASHSGEIKAIEDLARAEGTRAESERYKALLATVQPVLNSAHYPEAVKALAFRVLSGEANADVFAGALLAIDAINAKSEADAAVEDSDASEPTPATNADEQKVSTDGILRSAADVAADVASIKELF